ncbi:MAG: potassium channel protein [Candidatus Aenigmarchaeota archaeon]|nr:potassium channel protein [Candidatus Aenigmarchaeota archaeon]
MQENVKELLEEVKNLSELMLDLAHSSVFFESKEIAKEVLLLYSNLEDMEERLYLHLFAASRGRPAERLISVMGLLESEKMVANAARNMSEMVLEGTALHPIVKEALQGSDESITRVTLKSRSILIDKTIGELKLRTETGINVIAIRRGNKWLFSPGKHTQLLENDILIGTGPNASCIKMEKLAKGGLRKV